MEDYEKLYKEAIHRASGFRTQECKDVAEYIFPELAESGDERIRKEIINYFEHYPNIVVKRERKSDYIAWLEKQGQHANFINNIQVGDKVTRNRDGVLVNLSQLNRVAKKQDEQNPTYTKEYDFHSIKFIPKFAKGDIIKDKKCGEVSTIEDFSYDTGLYTYTYGQFPITIQDNYEIIEQKPTWSEEDERMYRGLHNLIYSTSYCDSRKEFSDFLNSLKDRVLPQPKQE
jgi:hypothetical protein